MKLAGAAEEKNLVQFRAKMPDALDQTHSANGPVRPGRNVTCQANQRRRNGQQRISASSELDTHPRAIAVRGKSGRLRPLVKSLDRLRSRWRRGLWLAGRETCAPFLGRSSCPAICGPRCGPFSPRSSWARLTTFLVAFFTLFFAAVFRTAFLTVFFAAVFFAGLRLVVAFTMIKFPLLICRHAFLCRQEA